jgi:hypothetical protein
MQTHNVEYEQLKTNRINNRQQAQTWLNYWMIPINLFEQSNDNPIFPH